MSVPVIIREFRPDDVPVLAALFQDTVRRVNRRDYSPEQVQAWAPEDVDLDRWGTLADHFTVIAEVNGRVAGFADLEPNGHLDRFYVHADHQGQGVGRALMLALLNEALRTGIRRLFSEVSITARPFFERHGFTVLAEQQVVVRGISFTNFRMERHLNRGAEPSL